MRWGFMVRKVCSILFNMSMLITRRVNNQWYTASKRFINIWLLKSLVCYILLKKLYKLKSLYPHKFPLYIVPKILKPPTKSVFLSNSMKGPKICEYFAHRQILFCIVYSKKVKFEFYLPRIFSHFIMAHTFMAYWLKSFTL